MKKLVHEEYKRGGKYFVLVGEKFIVFFLGTLHIIYSHTFVVVVVSIVPLCDC